MKFIILFCKGKQRHTDHHRTKLVAVAVYYIGDMNRKVKGLCPGSVFDFAWEYILDAFL
ncbi:hypothetical protein SLEP1_g3948 [Rubroshorea leprosula]|uniref:Uncharacterized protein n=1 Tax=Rubroshorea leprosula TaxID=152421 RepID=A0AAV5HWS2_9ROSI|nr:hypothetical protein SLEP1_g3948 [Rubroshorea leprosula]